MKISKSELIAMLKPIVNDDMDNGFNSAIIKLLQKSCKVNELTPYEKRKEIYKEHLLGYSFLSEEQVKEMDAIILAGQKLQAIKFHKELTNYGLKESKECFDTIFPLVAEFRQ